MSVFFSDEAIARLIQEDVPYLDLTTYGLGIGKQPGEIEFSTRHPMTICATEEAARVLKYCGAEVHYQVESGTVCQEKQLILQASGTAQALHSGWRVALNLMEYTSGIASRTRVLVDTAKTVNQSVSIVTTRKCFPGTRALSIKAVLAGGGFFHRLGLSETVLIFNQHLIFLGGIVGLIERMNELRRQFPEQHICVEVDTPKDASMAAQAGVDLIQFDKIPLPDLEPLVLKLKQQYPNLKLAAAGGITSENIKDYASTGVNILVTSSPYFGKPCDIAVKMTMAQ
ncbi:ModD protein [Nostoc sp.]|uniref:ModD protein n=1 Tax=Nostoc sp. TaxID=1180 RepID=UPI002FF771B4